MKLVDNVDGSEMRVGRGGPSRMGSCQSSDRAVFVNKALGNEGLQNTSKGYYFKKSWKRQIKD